MKPDLADRLARRKQVLDDLRDVLINNLQVRREPDEIDPDVSLFGSGLGLDSVDAVELVVCLDTRFGVRNYDRAASRASLRTVNSVVDLILAREGR